MESESKDKKKKPYSQAALTTLPRGQAIRLVAEHKNCSEEEAADFLDSLRRQPQPNRAKAVNDVKKENWKRSA
jgi:hypothetical protein